MAMEAWLTLLRAPALGPSRLRSLLARFGDAGRVLGFLRANPAAAELDEDSRRWLDAPDRALIEADLAWLAQPGHHLIGLDDTAYPAMLRDTASAPAALFVDGEASLLWMPQVAVVGSRSASSNGLATTRRFSRALAQAGFTITSGMADGIDGAAHAAALDAGGRTIAVLGTGPDLVYPRKHRELAARIAAEGALVSEFPPGTSARADHFPRRNRIIAGLALGTLVVEAGLKSGSLITARQANEQGRDVFAIPGSINTPLARGCHQLIRDGAVLCESADDIVSVLAAQASALGDRLRCVLRPLQQAEAEFPGPDESPAPAGRDAVYQRLIAAMGFDEVHLDMLVAQTGLDVATLSSMLLVLELEGEVVAAGGGSYQRIAATD